MSADLAIKSLESTYEDRHIESIRQRLEDGWNARLSLMKQSCPPNARALDLGARYGEYTLPLATIARHVDALDIDRESLDILSEFAAQFGIGNISTSHEEFVSWSEGRERSYDFCMCTGTWFYLTPKLRKLYFDVFRRLLTTDGYLFMDFYAPRYFLYRALFQSLPLKLRAHSLLAFFYRRLRRTYVTQRIFEREAKACGFDIISRGSEAYYACRELEGNNFHTVFGAYYSAYLLKIN